MNNVRGKVLGEPFPDKDEDEDNPEEFDAFLLGENTLTTVESIE